MTLKESLILKLVSSLIYEELKKELVKRGVMDAKLFDIIEEFFQKIPDKLKEKVNL